MFSVHGYSVYTLNADDQNGKIITNNENCKLLMVTDLLHFPLLFLSLSLLLALCLYSQFPSGSFVDLNFVFCVQNRDLNALCLRHNHIIMSSILVKIHRESKRNLLKIGLHEISNWLHHHTFTHSLHSTHDKTKDEQHTYSM